MAARPDDGTLRKAFALPPYLDMGPVKLEDLEFDLEDEVARLRADKGLSGVSPPSIQ